MFAPLGFDNEKFKTELCVKFQELGACPYNTRCRFAHGESELRAKPKPKQYKTKPCNNFIRTGKCPYGVRCNFLHGDPGSTIAQLQAQHQANTNPLGIPADHTQLRSRNPTETLMRQPLNTNTNTLTFQQRMRNRQAQGWENFMSGTKHSSGCYNVKTVHGFHCERPPISERFQAWKEMRGEGELPVHVLILQDNKQWISEYKKKQKSEELLLRQQQNLRQLSKLLLPKDGNGIGLKNENGDGNGMNVSDNSEGSKHRRHHRHRKHRRRSKNENGKDRSRSRSRNSRSVSGSDEEIEMGSVSVKEEECSGKKTEDMSDGGSVGGSIGGDVGDGDGSEVDKSPSLDDEDLSSMKDGSEMPLPE